MKPLNVLLSLYIVTSSSIHITNLFAPSSPITVVILSLTAPSASLIPIFNYSELNPRRKRIARGARLHMNIKTFFHGERILLPVPKNVFTPLH